MVCVSVGGRETLGMQRGVRDIQGRKRRVLADGTAQQRERETHTHNKRGAAGATHKGNAQGQAEIDKDKDKIKHA